jgi:hypothetical protein
MNGDRKTNQQLLMKIVEGQAELKTTVNDMKVRLFGGEGQEGALKFIYTRNDEQDKEIQATKDLVALEIKALKDNEIKTVEDKVAKLDMETSITMWKIGGLTSGAGLLLGAGLTYVGKKLGLM